MALHLHIFEKHPPMGWCGVRVINATSAAATLAAVTVANATVTEYQIFILL